MGKKCALVIWCEELTHWKRAWCWERLKASREGNDRGWDGWMASPTQCTWVWVSSGSGRWIGKPGVLQFMGSQRVGHNWMTGLNWTEQYTLSAILWGMSPPRGWSVWFHKDSRLEHLHALEMAFWHYVIWSYEICFQNTSFLEVRLSDCLGGEVSTLGGRESPG